jgi:hypothetical protein
MVCRSKADGSEYAVKIIQKKDNPMSVKQMREEIAIMRVHASTT